MINIAGEQSLTSIAPKLESSMKSYDQDARSACRGFRVSVAMKFGVGTLLPNTLPDGSSRRKD